MLTSEARSSRLHYSYYNLGWESSHIYQIPCLRRGAHCLYKSNTGTLGRGGGGQAGPDGGKISPSGPAFTLIQPYSQRQSAGNWQGARGGFRCSLWLPGLPEFSDVVLWLGLYTDMILLLILWFGVSTLVQRRTFLLAKLCTIKEPGLALWARAGASHVQHVLDGVWEHSWTLRNYCWIYPRTSHVIWVSRQCGARCQIDRPLLKNPILGRMCAALMKVGFSRIKNNISSCLALA